MAGIPGPPWRNRRTGEFVSIPLISKNCLSPFTISDLSSAIEFSAKIGGVNDLTEYATASNRIAPSTSSPALLRLDRITMSLVWSFVALTDSPHPAPASGKYRRKNAAGNGGLLWVIGRNYNAILTTGGYAERSGLWIRFLANFSRRPRADRLRWAAIHSRGSQRLDSKSW